MTITDINNRKFERIGKEKKIFYTSKGYAYFKWNGTRCYLSEILRLNPPIVYYTDSVRHAIIGYIGISNVFGVLVEISKDCETVILWNEIVERQGDIMSKNAQKTIDKF